MTFFILCKFHDTLIEINLNTHKNIEIKEKLNDYIIPLM